MKIKNKTLNNKNNQQNIQSMNILLAHTRNTPLQYYLSLTWYCRSKIIIVESNPLSSLAMGRKQVIESVPTTT
jgi:hypothetical protein